MNELLTDGHREYTNYNTEELRRAYEQHIEELAAEANAEPPTGGEGE
jgi:hypothetical protein